MSNSKPLLTLSLVTGCALIPMIAAFTLLFWPPETMKLDTIHHGQLLSPPLPLKSNSANMTTDSAQSSDQHWQLVEIKLSGNCSLSQTTTVAETSTANTTPSLSAKHRQIITALGRESHRVSQAQLCLKDLPLTKPEGNTYQGIVDPSNQLIMVYSSSMDQRSIYQDLKRLLKYNKLG